MVTQNSYPVGDRVQVKSLSGRYPLAAGLSDGDEVAVVEFEASRRTVEKDGTKYSVPLACIDSGSIHQQSIDREHRRRIRRSHVCQGWPTKG